MKIDNSYKKINDPTKKFNEAIKICKPLVKNYKSISYKIAEIAIDVCEIYHGGRRKNSELSLAKFAAKIGIGKSTLARWVKEYNAVVKNLNQKEIESGLNRVALEAAVKNETKSKGSGIKTYREINSLDADSIYMLNLRKKMGNCKFAICHSLHLPKIKEDDYNFLLECVSEMHEALKAKRFVSKRDVSKQVNQVLNYLN